MAKRKHVFISHHHADDQHVTKLTRLLDRHGYDIRNSSIRAKPANQRRLDQGLVSDNTIKRLLRIEDVLGVNGCRAHRQANSLARVGRLGD